MDYRRIIKRRMKELHIKQKELARQLGVSENAISSFLRGNSSTAYDHVVKIMDFLGMRIIYLPKEDLED